MLVFKTNKIRIRKATMKEIKKLAARRLRRLEQAMIFNQGSGSYEFITKDEKGKLHITKVKDESLWRD